MYVGWYEASMSATQPLTVIMSTLLGLISSSMILRDRGGGMMEGQDLGGSHMLCVLDQKISSSSWKYKLVPRNFQGNMMKY